MEIFRNSKRLRDVINGHILKIMMGPNYLESDRYGGKLQQLELGEFDEKYCFLYVPQDAAH